MKNRLAGIHIGLRTIKTAAAVIISMLAVDQFGATTSKLIFAMLGAMAAVQPTFMESVESCCTQIVGVLFGALSGVFLRLLSLPDLAAAGIGIVLVITLYNTLRIRYSPGLPCFIVVMICTTPDIQPISYALGRIWDTAIGLTTGLVINSLVFPYDNSQQIRSTVQSLDKELIFFLEDMFDGDSILPAADKMSRKVDDMARQLKIFSNQRLLTHLRKQQEELAFFRLCEKKAQKLLAHMEVLTHLGIPGCLSEENHNRLIQSGANIRDERCSVTAQELDIVTNYHVSTLLNLRQELLDALRNE